jgi:hypothetical protein
MVGRKLTRRWGTWYATLTAIAGYLLVTITAIALLRSYSEVPADFPARCCTSSVWQVWRPNWPSGPQSG